MNRKPYESYIALGDSLSEGLGDFTFKHYRDHNGWTDRLAAILAREAKEQGNSFKYANLSIRGAGLEKIVKVQVPQAVKLRPSLVTVMAGSNDLFGSKSNRENLRRIFRQGLIDLQDSGCHVVVANTINPLHLRIFRPLLHRAKAFSEMIEDVALELDVPVIDVHGIENFRHLMFWAEDMVHFSGHGHIAVANQAASMLGLKYRYPEMDPQELSVFSRGIVETVEWLIRDVSPFIQRRLKGITAGDRMLPKHMTLDQYVPSTSSHPNWELIPR